MMNKAFLKGIEQDLYQTYKTTEYANGKTPLSFDDWKEQIHDKKENVAQVKATTEKSIIKTNKKQLDKNTEPIEVDSYSFAEAAALLEIAESTINTYVSSGYYGFKRVGPNRVSKKSIDKEVKRRQSQDYLEKKRCDACNEEKSISRFYSGSDICRSCDKLERSKRYDEEQKLIEEKLKKENRIKNMVKDCYINGFFQCDNGFVAESIVSYLMPVYGQIQVFSKRKEEMSCLMFISDKNGAPLQFKTKSDIREAITELLRLKSVSTDNNRYKSY